MDDDCREIFRLFRATKPNAETRRTMMRQIADGMSMVSGSTRACIHNMTGKKVVFSFLIFLYFVRSYPPTNIHSLFLHIIQLLVCTILYINCKNHREFLLFQSIGILLGLGSDIIVQPTSPIVVLLESGVDPNALSHPWGGPPDEGSSRPLHLLIDMTAPNMDLMERQVIIAKQLIEAGADVNAVNAPGQGRNSPLHNACFSGECTNLELIKLFLDHGANPNLGNNVGQTPLMMTLRMSPSAAKLLLTYPYENSPAPAIDVNVRADDGSIYFGGLQDGIDMMQDAAMRVSLGLPSGQQMDWKHPAQYEYFIGQLEEVKCLVEALGGVGAAEGWKTPREIYTLEELRRMNAPSCPTTHHGPPLPYDVKCLLGQELLFGVRGHPGEDRGDSPDWYRYHPFYVCDSESKQFAILKKKQYLRTGKMPKVGLRVEIKVIIPAGSSTKIAARNEKEWHWGRLQGKITEVCTQPTEAQLASSDSQLYKTPCLCGDPECHGTKTGESSEIIDKYGAVHGQEVKGIVSLSEEFINHVPLMAFFRGNETRYSVTLRMNDRKENMVRIIRCKPFLVIYVYL